MKMSQQNNVTKALLGGAITLTGLLSSSTVFADVENHTSSSGGGADVIKSGEVTSESDVEHLNDEILRLMQDYPNVVKVDFEKEITLTPEQAKKYALVLESLKADVATLAQKQKELDMQLALSGDDSARSSRATVLSGELKDLKAGIQERTQRLNQLLQENKERLLEKAENNDNQIVKDALKEANRTLAANSQTAIHSNDGVIGNFDKIKRKAEDSRKLNQEGSIGVDVDTSKTERVNNTTLEQKEIIKKLDLASKRTTEEKIAAISQARDEVLKAIREAAQAEQAKTNQVGDYTNRSLNNIDDINAWLKKERARATEVQNTIKENSTAIKSYDDYKTQTIAKLKTLREKAQGLRSAKQKEKALAMLDQAIAQIEASGLTVQVQETVNAAKDVDFGNIGRDNSEVKAIQKQASDIVTAAINKHLEKVKSSNKEAEDALKQTKGVNDPQLEEFAKNLDKALTRGVTQVDTAWVESQKIYQESPDYREYIKKAIAQTEDDVEHVFQSEQKHGDITVKTVHPNTSAATASAAEYAAQSKNGFENGFGSPMMPSKNVNDFISVRGRKFAESKSFAGGVQGMFDALQAAGTGHGGYPVDIKSTSVYKDVMGQYANSGIGLKNTYMVFSTKPEATFDLKDAFVSVDKDGNVRRHNMSLTLRVKSDTGSDIPSALYGHENDKYVRYIYAFYMGVDPKTGSLVTGAGYFDFANAGDGIKDDGGHGNTGSGGEGGLSLGNGHAGSDDPEQLTNVVAKHPYGKPNNALLSERRSPGMIMETETYVQDSAGDWARYAPLYVSDIDDGQFVTVPNGKKLDVVMSGNGVNVENKGSFTKITSNNLGKTSGANGTTNLDSQSVLFFGSDKNPGDMNGAFGIGHDGNGRRGADSLPYQSVDVKLFAPYGVVGEVPLKMALQRIQSTLKTFQLGDPSAKAHTDNPQHNVQVTGKITGNRGSEPKLTHEKTEIVLPTIKKEKQVEKRVSSNDSLIVKELSSKKRTSSQNSFIIRELTKTTRTSSQNSFVIRQLEDVVKRTSSQNSFIIRQIDQAYKPQTLDVDPNAGTGTNSSSTFNKSSVLSLLSNETKAEDKKEELKNKLITPKKPTTVNFKVYVEAGSEEATKRAMKLWQDALAKLGLNLNITYTSNIADLIDGVDLAVLDADNTTTRLDFAKASKNVENDKDFEMSDLAGLTTKVTENAFVEADSNDKYNKSGTIRDGSLFRKTTTVVQVNHDSQATAEDKYVTLAHEFGHVFGLQHDDNDPLMATFRSSVKAIISDKSAQGALKHFCPYC